MRVRRLSKSTRTLVFFLGVTMITMAGAIERVEQSEEMAQQAHAAHCHGARQATDHATRLRP